MNFPTGTRGRVVAVAILAILVILLLNIVVMPLLGSYASQSEEIASLNEDIGRYQRILSELPSLRSNIEKFEREQPLDPYMLPGTNAALAAASLQRMLQDVAVKNGLRIVSVRAQQPERDGPLERISVQARLQVDMRGLRNTLHELESTSPYLFIDDLSVTSRPVRRRRGRTQQTGTLEVNLTVSGLRIPNREANYG